MTGEDAVYAEWLDILGSDVEEPPAIAEALHLLHDRAEASHAADTSGGVSEAGA